QPTFDQTCIYRHCALRPRSILVSGAQKVGRLTRPGVSEQIVVSPIDLLGDPEVALLRLPVAARAVRVVAQHHPSVSGLDLEDIEGVRDPEAREGPREVVVRLSRMRSAGPQTPDLTQ